jgi:alpha-L-fucosidase
MTHCSQWWEEARFGMFIHWGVYAIPARGEWVMYHEHIPHEEYAPLANEFNPKKYDPDAWVQLAKEAGMRYMVMTSRHHDGFSLFDSHVSDFTAPKTAAGRDLLREYVEACHRGGMRVGFYYSLLDWRYPAYFRGPQRDPEGWKELVDYVHAQVRELCSNYGKVDILWYDGGWPYTAEDWRSRELNEMVRDLQPEILINNRSQLPEDFDTPEQHVRSSDPGRLWEACMTLNRSWGYNEADDQWKTPQEVLLYLTRCVSGGGNFLLNVGPKADGTIPRESSRVLRRVGQWLEKNGGSIYGAGRASFGSAVGFSTIRGNTAYMHVLRWPGREIQFSRIMNRVRSVHLMESGDEVTFEQQGDRLMLRKLPRRAPNELDTVIVVELEGEPQAMDYFEQGWQGDLTPEVKETPEAEPKQEAEAAVAPETDEAEEEMI